ncbi:MAG: two-component system sensor histidine kinase QseC [Phenylobacterium sp.]
MQLLEALVIYSNKPKRTQSIAFKLRLYFVSSGCVVFGLLLILFLSNSEKFADLVVENGFNHVSTEMVDAFYIDDAGVLKSDAAKVELKWGFDALYSNIAYRVVEIPSQQVVLQSAPKGTQGFLFDGVSLDIPLNYSRADEWRASLFRAKISLGKKNYYFDLIRSDLMGELANQAVRPAIVKVGIALIIAAFLLFLSLSVIAIWLIVKPANALSQQIERLKPEDLHKRIDVIDIPKELFPIANAMNDALERVENSFEQQKRFIADAAHELRTPLTIFLSRLELKIPSSAAKDELIKDAHYISRILEQLLDLSRAENINDQKITPIKLLDVVKNVCMHLAPLAVDKSQDLELVEAKLLDSLEASTVMIDEGELTVVVKNLLENAIKHSPAGAKIKVSVEGKVLTVEDSGKGIPLAHQQQIFERFWRENQSDRTGSGLGLAITKALLSHYDASIKVDNESSLGGARFVVSFNN